MSLQQIQETERGLREALAACLARDLSGIQEALANPVVRDRFDAVEALACVHAAHLGLNLGTFSFLLWKPELIADPDLVEPIERSAVGVLARAAAFNRFCSEELGQDPDAVLGLSDWRMVSMQRWLMLATGLKDLAPDPVIREQHYSLLKHYWLKFSKNLPAPELPALGSGSEGGL